MRDDALAREPLERDEFAPYLFGRPPVMVRIEILDIDPARIDVRARCGEAIIIGAPSQEMSRNEIAGTETVMYMWEGSMGANMNAMFQNNKLVQKAQFGLR